MFSNESLVKSQSTLTVLVEAWMPVAKAPASTLTKMLSVPVHVPLYDSVSVT
jgi:hypothetical protein